MIGAMLFRGSVNGKVMAGFWTGCLSRMHIINIIDSKRWGEILSFELWLLNMNNKLKAKIRAKRVFLCEAHNEIMDF